MYFISQLQFPLPLLLPGPPQLHSVLNPASHSSIAAQERAGLPQESTILLQPDKIMLLLSKI